jgi:hypothetical protein
MSGCSILQVVKKTTGGKAWLPKWGFHGLTKTQKANRRKNLKFEQGTLQTLRQAGAQEGPHVPATATTQ